MIDGFPLPFGVLAPSGLLAVVLLLIFTGHLVPRPFYREKVKQAERLQEALDKALDQNQRLIQSFGPTFIALMEGIHEKAAEVRSSDSRGGP